ncbi:hypothetical protein [Micromonospora sp. NPDC005171]|uniref:hypothetical protein n=1 Tax=Micromonospora sp. NPDC005171 TaxID=3156866 RepID=UPI0033B8E4B3
MGAPAAGKDGTLLVDLLSTPEQVTRVVRLSLAAGLVNMRIGRSTEERQWAAGRIGIPDTWAAGTSVSLLKLISSLEGTPADRLIANWEHDNGESFNAAESQHQPVNAS